MNSRGLSGGISWDEPTRDDNLKVGRGCDSGSSPAQSPADSSSLVIRAAARSSWGRAGKCGGAGDESGGVPEYEKYGVRSLCRTPYSRTSYSGSHSEKGTSPSYSLGGENWDSSRLRLERLLGLHAFVAVLVHLLELLDLLHLVRLVEALDVLQQVVFQTGGRRGAALPLLPDGVALRPSRRLCVPLRWSDSSGRGRRRSGAGSAWAITVERALDAVGHEHAAQVGLRRRRSRRCGCRSP